MLLFDQILTYKNAWKINNLLKKRQNLIVTQVILARSSDNLKKFHLQLFEYIFSSKLTYLLQVVKVY